MSTVTLNLNQSIAKIAIHGAHIYSWKIDGQEVLFTSATTGTSPIRGGIPICFPVFGPPPDRAPFLGLKQHGFARTSSDWTLYSMPKNSVAKFRLRPSNATEAIFAPTNWSVMYTVELQSNGLKTSLEVTNPDDSKEPFEFQALFHTYFRLPSSLKPENIFVRPLDGCKYIDRAQGGKSAVETNAHGCGFQDGEVDRTYQVLHNEPIEIVSSSKKEPLIVIHRTNLPDVTVWNPAKVKSEAMSDMEQDGWLKFICVEPGVSFNFVNLKPGETWTGTQLIKVSQVSDK